MANTDPRQKMLEQGVELLYENGFESTGVQEITKSCGVPKGSFYYYFDSKEAFGVTVLEAYVDVSRQMLIDALVEAEGTPLERLRALVDGWIAGLEEGEFRRGCLAGNLCQEMADRSPEFQGALRAWFDELQSYFVRCFEEAKSVGELAPGDDPAELAEFFYNGWQGALLRMKASRSRRPLDNFRALFFDRILG